MVRRVSIVSVGRNGVRDHLIQRGTALILLAYVLFLVGVFLTRPEISYGQWRELFAHDAMRVFSLLALVSLCAHAWVGMWTVATDYLTPRMVGKAGPALRLLFELLCLLIIFAYLVWGIRILWSI